MIPQETVNQILDAAQIVDVVGDFVTLKRRGANYVACCPFHNEKTPSFYVSPSKGIYKCFGCGKSGTAVGFIMEHENLTYVEALRYLARKYGIEVNEKEESAEDIAARQRSESLLLVSEAAGKFFADSLSTEEGRTIGLAYFKSRGLEEETIKKYGLGWAPRSRHALLDYAKSAGYKEEYLVDTGLCVKHDDGKLSDRFYDRVMFPVHSVSGRVIAFGGRTLRTDKTIAKYVNSPETEIYDKSRSLYGIYFAKNEISRSQKCYLVEGYLDVLSMHQLGITNVVASSGTSLTVPQIRLIKKFTENVTIMYDGDSAGI
ncbi:MAG: DNA primase, partial [Bacteroidales bacterium]|nr:DNA primase [Bacteroidales bacterium]